MFPGRTTPANVAAIIEVDLTIVGDDLSGLDPFIDAANEMVSECCTTTGSTYTPYRLELIERWLSAHFYAIRDPRPVSERAGPVAESYQKVVDQGLEATQYGQMALRLDSRGGLAAKNNKVKHMRDLPVGIFHLGRRSSFNLNPPTSPTP